MTDVMRTEPPSGQVRCTTCAAPYRPRLTGGACPVCDAPAPGDASPPRWRGRWAEPDDRLLAIVGLATLLNLALFGLLAALVARH